MHVHPETRPPAGPPAWAIAAPWLACGVISTSQAYFMAPGERPRPRPRARGPAPAVAVPRRRRPAGRPHRPPLPADPRDLEDGDPPAHRRQPPDRRRLRVDRQPRRVR